MMTSTVRRDGLAELLTPAISDARRAALRISTIPARSAATTGRAMQLFASVLRYSVTDTISLRIPVSELLVQAWTLFKVTAIPAVLMAIPFGAMVSVVTAGLVNQVGANALIGAASGVGVVRQGAPITAGLLMGGAAASAIASDFGARAVREELDAMRVIGIDPVRRLVVPRFLALLLVAPILCTVIIVSGTTAAFILAVTVTDIAPGSYWMSFGTFTKLPDMWFAMGKTDGVCSDCGDSIIVSRNGGKGRSERCRRRRKCIGSDQCNLYCFREPRDNTAGDDVLPDGDRVMASHSSDRAHHSRLFSDAIRATRTPWRGSGHPSEGAQERTVGQWVVFIAQTFWYLPTNVAPIPAANVAGNEQPRLGPGLDHRRRRRDEHFCNPRNRLGAFLGSRGVCHLESDRVWRAVGDHWRGGRRSRDRSASGRYRVRLTGGMPDDCRNRHHAHRGRD